MNTSQQLRRSRRSGCRRNRSHSGGGGMGWTMGPSVARAEAPYATENVPVSSCGSAVRPGFISHSPTVGGLPGYSASGGARYTFQPEVYGPNAITNSPSIGCDVAAQNPLNKGDIYSLVTNPAPQVGMPVPFSFKGGSRKNKKQRGGMAPTITGRGVDSMVYEAPRSGYSAYVPSNLGGGPQGDGAVPFAVITPYATQPTVSSACTKTGGGRRKNRKSSRKNRKSYRKNRKTRRN